MRCDGFGSRRISFHPDGSVVLSGRGGQAERVVEERHHGGSIEEQAKAAPNDEIAALARLVGETQTRADVLPVLRIDIADLLSGNYQAALRRIEDREIILRRRGSVPRYS